MRPPALAWRGDPDSPDLANTLAASACDSRLRIADLGNLARGLGVELVPLDESMRWSRPSSAARMRAKISAPAGRMTTVRLPGLVR